MMNREEKQQDVIKHTFPMKEKEMMNRENDEIMSRGKTLGAWKKYAEENYPNTPPQVLKYIIVLEEELGRFSQHDVSGMLPTIDECLKFAWEETQKENKSTNIDITLLIKIIEYSQGN